MSRTYKDRPYKLGGDRHRYNCVSNHNSHGKFTRLMRRLARKDLNRQLQQTGDLISKSHYQKEYYD